MEQKDKDISVLMGFLQVYCQQNHSQREKRLPSEFKEELCEECIQLASYSIKRRKYCPKEPKPACKSCDTPCYQSPYREKIREVMKFSGKYFIKKGRIDYLFKYFL